ncbi:hypothetical protein V1477_018739 [Vespula maculifrons]|uniref:Uncharacterized protein n=1 Tax=Vespula maculifrons TaxID=7453 RepID=A0ABD2AW77_VESMC
MKSSRKGMKLNDAQYFKNPLPHTREKMTMMFLLQRISNLETKYPHDSEDFSINFDAKTKNHGKKINLTEKSTEMAFVNHDDGCSYMSNEELSKGFFREVFVGTNGDLLRGSSKSIIGKIEQSDMVVADNIKNEKEEESMESDGVRQEKMNDRRIHCENKRHWSRWRNSWITQLILHLFYQIMGKSKKKYAIEEEEKSDAPKSLSYLVYRKEENPIVDQKSREEIVSTFVRQIQRTRDKNLRVMLLQRELETRLPAENTFSSKVYDELDSPRLSSPLC